MAFVNPRQVLVVSLHIGHPIGYYSIERQANPKRKWPLLALAAFLTWKIGWVIAARRKLAACTRS